LSTDSPMRLPPLRQCRRRPAVTPALPISRPAAATPASGDVRRARHRGLSTKLYAWASLVLAALAIQVAGSIFVAGAIRATGDRLVRHNLDAITLAGRWHEVLTGHRHLIETTSGVEHADELAPRAAARRDGVRQLHELIQLAAGSGATLPRVLRTLAEFDLTGAAVLEQAQTLLAERARTGAADPTAIQRSLRVFAVAAARLAEDVWQWRREHQNDAKLAAANMFATVDTAARWAVIGGLATAAVAMLSLLVLSGAVGRLDAITAIILRLARHEPDIAIPDRDDRGPIGDIARAVAILADDVRELERRGIAETQTSQLLDAALNSMIQGLASTGADGRLRIWNDRFATILGLPDRSLRLGMTVREALAGCHDNAAGALAPPPEPPAGEPQPASHQSIVALDRALVIRAHWVRMRDGGWLGTFDDITRLQRTEAQLVHLTQHDALTDLPNRTALRDAVTRAAAHLSAAASRTDTPLAVLSVNLDRFRAVNDSLGHEAGDALLRQAAERLRLHVRAEDTIARVGADSFAIVQTTVAHASGTVAFANRLIEILSEPYTVADAMVVVGASVGIAVPGLGPIDAEALLRNADLARQHARRDGGGTVRLFAPEMDAAAQERRLLELDLRQALERGEFELHYQPLVAVHSRRICAFEALLRWHHPDRGMVRPDLFIPLAEEVGLIWSIGDWVLTRACAEAAGWPKDVGVAVNLSPVQFTRGGLVEQVQAAIAQAGIAPDRLELEITERVLLRDSADTLATLHRLRALGVRISLDDFGTGYSSLSYLRSFPFDKIKIDKSFVHGLDAGPSGAGESEAIVRAIAGLGHSLGIATTAEGVETVAQLDALVADGCTEMQGYLFSPPRPASEVAGLLAVADSWPAWAAPATLPPSEPRRQRAR